MSQIFWPLVLHPKKKAQKRQSIQHEKKVCAWSTWELLLLYILGFGETDANKHSATESYSMKLGVVGLSD